jgi:uncharacterized membrane protein YbhN (UPF0104 family)
VRGMGFAARVRRILPFLERHRRLKIALEVGVGLVVVGCCAYAVRNEWAKAGPLLADTRPRWFALALLTVAAYYLVFVLGWLRILAALGVSVSYSAALQSEMISMLAKYVPGGVWTPAARVAALRRLGGTDASGTVLASILIEALLSALAGVVVFVVSLAWVRGVNAPLIPLLLFGVLCAALLHPRVIGALAPRVLRPFGVRALAPLPFSTMLALLGFYCSTWLVGGLGVLFELRSLGADPRLTLVPFLGGAAAVGAIAAVLAFVTPSGLGVREAATYGLLIAVTNDSTALSATVLNRIAITAVEIGLFVCGIVLWRAGNRRAGREAPAESAIVTD